MQAELQEMKLESSKIEHKLQVREKKRLREILTDTEIVQIEAGWLVATCEGQKLKLDEDVKGTIMVLSPLQSG